MTHVIKNDQRTVDTSDSVVANARLDGGHPGVNKVGRHDDESSTEVKEAKDEIEGQKQIGVNVVVEDRIAWGNGVQLGGEAREMLSPATINAPR